MNRGQLLRIFVAEHGERARMLLRFILEESSRSREGLGDFSFKDIKERFKAAGIEYNPSPLLAKLEREIGIIETTYRSTTQRWWRVIDRDSIEEALGGERELSLRARVLRAQFYSLRPRELMDLLERAKGRQIGEAERARLRKAAFEELPLLLRVVEEARASGEEEALADEIRLAETLIKLFEEVIVGSAAREGLSLRHPQASEAWLERP